MPLPDRLLCLVASPLEASAIVGDLMEEHGSKGAFWFWSQLLRAMAIAVLQDMRGNLRPLLRLGVTSLGMMICFGFGAIAVAVLIGDGFGITIPIHFAVAARDLLVVGVIGYSGGWMANQVPGHEVSAGLIGGATVAGILWLFLAGLDLLCQLACGYGPTWEMWLILAQDGALLTANFLAGALLLGIYRVARMKSA